MSKTTYHYLLWLLAHLHIIRLNCSIEYFPIYIVCVLDFYNYFTRTFRGLVNGFEWIVDKTNVIDQALLEWPSNQVGGMQASCVCY